MRVSAVNRVRLKCAHERPAGKEDPIAPLIGKVVPHDSRELAVLWPDAGGVLQFFQHSLLVDVEAPRPVVEGDHIRVLRPVWSDAWATWIGVVRKLFDDGACVLEPVQGAGDFEGAYVLKELDGFEHVDGARIVPHPGIRCFELRGGCSRNPRGACVRCGDLG